MVLRTRKILDEASESLSGGLSIRWCKSHQDRSDAHKGNSNADRLARSGAVLSNYGQLVDEDELPLRSFSALKRDIHYLIKKEWQNRWTNGFQSNPPCVATKNWLPNIDYNWSKKLLLGANSRSEYSTVIQIVSGHSYLLDHEARIRGYPSPPCRLCKDPNSKEDTMHLMSECEALAYTRFVTLHHPFPPPPWVYIPVWKVLCFLRKVPIQFLPYSDT